MTEKKKRRWDEIIKRLKGIKNPVAVEVGVWTGKTSKRILEKNPTLFLYMIDRWEVPVEGDTYFQSDRISKMPAVDFLKAYQSSLRIHQVYKNRSKIVKSDSVLAAAQFKDEFFDLIFIDGDHSYIGCKRDIIAWLPKLKKGGWFGGHDYNHPEIGEVKRAVDEIFPKIEIGDNNTWWIRK